MPSRWRWRLLTIWCVLFSLLVAWTLHVHQRDSRSNERRFCAINAAFITSNVALRNAQNAASVEAIGDRQAIIETEQGLIRIVRESDVPLTRVQHAFIAYLRAEAALNRSLNRGSVDSLNAADVAVGQWMHLRKELRCAT